MQCRICKEEKKPGEIRFIDEIPYCLNCLFENHPPFLIYPIGFVENNLTRDGNFHLKGNRHDLSKIHLFSSQKPFIYKLEDGEEYTFAHTGNEAGLARLEEIMQEAEENDPYYHGNYIYIRGLIASIQGDYNRSLDLLESARDHGLSFHGHLYFLDVDLMPLFDHPRFVALIDPLNAVQ